ncbi:MAG: esterase family protein [Lachnospiraceae bacterium]|nr:esterase family protein [Lachnospiraceae bacterium]
MAIAQVQIFSTSLQRDVPVTVILPTDALNGENFVNKPDHKFKTLFLLHGFFGNHMDWLTYTNIRRYATDANIAVVMPSGENGFYVDLEIPNARYSRFIGEELPELMRRMFPLSRRRADTFIGGLSMGGFGALRIGLKYADTFSAIVAMSSALHLTEVSREAEGFRMVANEDQLFGNWTKAMKSDKNPEVCLKQLEERVAGNVSQFPDVYMVCGLQDDLLSANRSFKEKLEKAGVPVTYEEGEGGHEWDYWDKHIRYVLTEWLPLRKSRK